MINLPQVTLITLSGLGYMANEHLEAIKKSTQGINFGAVKYIQLSEIVDLDTYSRAMIQELPKYVDTEYCLTVQADGWVVNPELWDDEWLRYDYIGAPWPMPTDSISYRDKNGVIRRVGNGAVSLRSKRLLEAGKLNKWESFYGFANEDGFICVNKVHVYEAAGCKIAPLEVAKHFSKELEIPENKGLRTFAFHKYVYRENT